MHKFNKNNQVFIAPLHAWGLLASIVSAFVALFVSFKMAILGLFFVVIAWWSWLNTTMSFMFLLIVSPLLPLLKVTQTMSTATLVKDIIIITLFARLFALPLILKRLPYRRNILFAPIVLLGIWVAVNAAKADNILLGVLRSREILLYPLVYFIVLYLPRRKNFYRDLVIVAVSGFILTAILAGYQWQFANSSTVLRFDPARSIWIPRISSSLGHPSIYGQYLTTLLLVFTAISWMLPRQAAKYLLLLAAGLTLPLIYLTFSRGVWIGSAISLFCLAGTVTAAQWRSKQVKKVSWHLVVPVLLGCIIVVSILWQFTPVGTFLSSSFDAGYKSNAVRLEFIARLVAPLSNTAALFGQGLGDVVTQNFREIDLTGFELATGAAQSVQAAKDTTLVDNQFLKTFIEMGLLGLLIYGWLWWRLVKASFKLFYIHSETAAQHPQASIGLLGMGFMIAFAIQAFFIDIWDIYPTNLIFWMIAGLISRETQNFKSPDANDATRQ